MRIQHKLAFGVYHWDTFDNVALLVGEADLLADAEKIAQEKYKDRLRSDGADSIDIVDKDGCVVASYKTG